MVAIINILLTGLTAALAVTGTNAAKAPVSKSYGFIPLGFVGSYAAVGGESISNTGLTYITGNIATPTLELTGFPPGFVTGTTDVYNAAATRAYSSYRTAYAKGRTLTPTVYKGGKATLDDEVLPAGVYKYDGALALTGTFTLDARGDSTSVWVFQIAKTLITFGASKMLLVGGAKSSNIFWIVGSSATLGTSSVVQGSIIAGNDITLNTRATINGGIYAGSNIVLQFATVSVNPAAALSPLRKARSVSFRA